MKNLSYTLSCIKKDVYTFLSYFLRVSCSLSSHFLCHPPLGLSNSSLTLRERAQPFFSERCPFFRALHLGIQFSLHPASAFFGTQQQLTHPPLKSSSLPLWKNHVSQAHCCVMFSMSWLSLVWYSPILLIKSKYTFTLSVVYFYSERPPLCKIIYSMCGLFL